MLPSVYNKRQREFQHIPVHCYSIHMYIKVGNPIIHKRHLNIKNKMDDKSKQNSQSRAKKLSEKGMQFTTFF